MNRSIHSLIQSEYEKRQKAAFDGLMARKSEVYSKIPGFSEIESQIQLCGIRHNKMILSAQSPNSKAEQDLLAELGILKKEKERQLCEHDYPADYLKPVYQCPACCDTGFLETGTGALKCACYKQQLVNHLFNRSNLKPAEAENFSNFREDCYPDVVDEARYGIKISPRENILRIKERALRFIENFDSNEEKNLFFSGHAGVGKTFMSNCIGMELLSRGRTVLYQTAPSLFATINEHRMRSFKEEDYQDSDLNSIFEVELLIIDDLATESPTAARYAEFLTILNKRHANNLMRPCKTIISTNIGVKELYEYYDERSASRIIGSFDMYRLTGEDIRRLKKMSGK